MVRQHFLGCGFASAQESQDVVDKRAQLNAELAQIESDIEAQRGVLSEKQQEKASLERDVAILNANDFYAAKIDETLKANPAVANMDILSMLRILAVMEYDFYNGENKDELARKILGEKGFLENQTRRQMGARFGTQAR